MEFLYGFLFGVYILGMAVVYCAEEIDDMHYKDIIINKTITRILTLVFWPPIIILGLLSELYYYYRK